LQYRIGEFAELGGVSAKTLRYYDEIGLLRPSGVDARTGYRCYTKDLITRIGLDDVVSQGYSFQIEMVWRARRLGYSVVEVPIRFEDRVAGASKVSRGEVRRALWTVLRLSLGRWKR